MVTKTLQNWNWIWPRVAVTLIAGVTMAFMVQIVRLERYMVQVSGQLEQLTSREIPPGWFERDVEALERRVEHLERSLHKFPGED